jgi:sirohydrochlorin cobaltochelatase
MAARALILFAHGSRDARWAEPFERVRALVAAAAGETRVELAYLELMSPDLAAVLESVVSSGITRIDIVPLFLGQGGHLRRDLPALVAGLQAVHPGIDIRCAPAAGEDPGVLAALASYCLQTAR